MRACPERVVAPEPRIRRASSAACALLVIAGQAFAQHDERPNMPPAPPEPHRTSTPAVNGFPRGQFNSVQVNVTQEGLNILNDAANEPSIAVDPTARLRMVIGWRQFDTINSSFRQAGRAYTNDGGRTWHFPGVLTPGTFRSDPVVRADNEGNFYYSSLEGDLTTDMFRSSDGGVTFEGPFPSFGGDKQWIAIDRTGRPSAGTQYQHYTNAFTRSFDRGMTWTSPIPSVPVWGTSTVGPSGSLYIAGAFTPGGGSPFRLVRSDNADFPKAPPTFLNFTVNLGGTQRAFASASPNPGGLLGQVNVDVDRSGGPRHGWVYVLCSVSRPGDPLDVMFNRSTDGGQTWLASPVRVNNDAPGNWQWFGTMSVAPNGRIDVVWNDTRDSGQAGVSRLYYAWSDDGGDTWQGNIPVGPPFNSLVGWPQQNKIGDYYDMESDLLGVNIAYSATYNGEQDVYFLRIGPEDCDASGVADAEQIAADPSLDCNADGILDACQIAAGTLTDANKNGIPDECACAADWNSDKIVNSQDLFDFLVDFFALDADFNADGATNSQDFFDYLGAFFSGC